MRLILLASILFFSLPKLLSQDCPIAGQVRQYFTKESEKPPSDSTWCEVFTELFENEVLFFKLKDIEIIENK